MEKVIAVVGGGMSVSTLKKVLEEKGIEPVIVVGTPRVSTPSLVSIGECHEGTPLKKKG